jgi:hypothetical protein
VDLPEPIPPVKPTARMADTDIIITLRRPDSLLFSPRADERLAAARKAGKRERSALAERIGDWPPNSPGSLNAWLLLVTTKAPVWRDQVLEWRERPLALGEVNENFFYPDPLGFWTEIRRWALELFHLRNPTWGLGEALTLTTLLHVGDDPSRLASAIERLAPRVVLFLDEPSWMASGLQVKKQVKHHIRDPHRPAQVYEGFWGVLEDGRVVGKAPQHPTTHNLYRHEDMVGFRQSAPIPD